MTRKECIDLLKEMKTIYFKHKKDKTVLLNTMKAEVKKLRKGRQVFKQLSKYVYADEYDKALKYLRKAIRKSRFWPISSITFYELGGVIYVIFGLTAVAIFLLIVGYRLTRLAEESPNWPKTTGYITESYFYEDADDDGDVSYRPNIVYNYTVFGKEYTSEQRGINVLTNFQEIAEADSIVKRYPKDSLVNVFYNPKKHDFAVLEPGTDGSEHFTVYMGYLFLSLAFIMFSILFTFTVVSIVRTEKTG